MTDFDTSAEPALQELRASLDERLDALENALADPQQHPSLERLVLELARVATEEADASARMAVGAIRTEGLSALEAERKTVAALRREVEDAEQQLARLGHQLAEAQEQVASSTGAAERAQAEQSALQRELERARAELVTVREAREQEQAERTTFKRELENALGMVKTERARIAGLEESLARAAAELTAARHDAEARVTDLSGSQADLQETLAEARRLLRDMQARAENAEARAAESEARAAESRARAEAAETRSEALQVRAEDAEVRAAEADARADQQQVHAAEAILERDSLKEELDTLSSGSAEHDSGKAAKYEELLHSSEHRIRSLELALRDAETRAEAAECELALQRRGAASWADGERKPAASDTIGAPAFPGPVRGATRVAVGGDLAIEVDGARAKLVDVSTTGAQILASASMKPNRLVRLTVPHADRTIICKGKIMWARLEPKAGEIWYRAGLCFTTVDQSELDGFIKSQPALR